MDTLESYIQRMGGLLIVIPPFLMICSVIAGMLLFGIIREKQALFLTLMLIGSAGIAYLYLKTVFESMGGSGGVESLAIHTAKSEVCPQINTLFTNICQAGDLVAPFAGEVSNALCETAGCGSCNYDSSNCPSS